MCVVLVLVVCFVLVPVSTEDVVYLVVVSVVGVFLVLMVCSVVDCVTLVVSSVVILIVGLKVLVVYVGTLPMSIQSPS